MAVIIMIAVIATATIRLLVLFGHIRCLYRSALGQRRRYRSGHCRWIA